MNRRSALSAVTLISVLLLAQVVGAQTFTIQISDQSTGVPETQGTFDIRVEATSVDVIQLVRVYLWFEVPEGITPTEIIALDSLGSNLYGTTVDIPQNASTMNYYIAAYDAQSGKNSDAVNRQVKDTFPPVASCPASEQTGMGESISFDASASTDNVAVDNCTWSFTYGDSSVVLYGTSPSFLFSVPGSYPGILTVKDAWGNSDTAAFTVSVTDPEDPVAEAGYELTVYSGNLLFFDGSASTDNHMIANYTWQLTHNGTAVLLHGQSPEYVFWAPGDYVVTLTVTDAMGNTAVDQVPVHVLKGNTDGTGISWWVYALAIMVILIVAAGLFIIRA